MMYLVQGQENTENLLVFNAIGRSSSSPSLDKGGQLIDPYEVKFQIRNSAGTKIFPEAPSTWEVLTDTSGELGTGRYYAYDAADTDSPWTPSSSLPPGAYTIEWRWTETSGGTEYRWLQKFRVESSAYAGISYATYISPGEIRDEGITASDLSNSRLERLIEQVQNYIEQMTRNVFRPVYMEYVLDGAHNDRVFLSHPIIGIDELKANGNTSAISSSSFAVAYERVDQLHKVVSSPDRRRNPWLRFRGATDIYSGVQSRFRKGASNIVVTGVFGFLESDGSCPPLIRDAALRLVSLNAPKLPVGSANHGNHGAPINYETVDRHTISYSVQHSASARTLLALAGAREVEEVLTMYRAPIRLAAPAPAKVWDTGYSSYDL